MEGCAWEGVHGVLCRAPSLQGLQPRGSKVRCQRRARGSGSPRRGARRPPPRRLPSRPAPAPPPAPRARAPRRTGPRRAARRLRRGAQRAGGREERGPDTLAGWRVSATLASAGRSAHCCAPVGAETALSTSASCMRRSASSTMSERCGAIGTSSSTKPGRTLMTAGGASGEKPVAMMRASERACSTIYWPPLLCCDATVDGNRPNAVKTE